MSDHLNWSAVSMYCQMGVQVFPVVYAGKTPLLPGNWKTAATNDPHRAQSLFPRNGHWNIAVALGPGSNLLDIEVDKDKSFEALSQMFSFYGEPRTVAYRSKRGIHRWFKWNARLGEIGKSVLKWADIECRLGTGDRGAYSVVPPSRHESMDAFYEWLPGQAPWQVPVMDLPQWMEELWLEEQKNFISKSVIGVSRQGDDLVPEPGQRHDYLIRFGNLLAGSLRLPRDLAEDLLLSTAEYMGKVSERGLEATRKECHDIIRTAKRPEIPEEEFPTIDFEEMYDQAKTLAANLKAEEREKINPESLIAIPRGIFHPFLEEMADHAHAAQYSRNLVLMSMLGAASAAVGNGMDVRFSPHAASTGLQMFSVGVAGASVGKSRCLNTFYQPLTEGKAYCTDATTAALVNLLHDNQRGALLKITEGKEFTAMLGRYASQNASDAAGVSENAIFLQAWSGELIRSLRAKGVTEIVRPFLTIGAAIQPYGLNSFGVHDTMDGLLQRTLTYDSENVPDTASEHSLKWLAENYQKYVKVMDRLKSIRPLVFQAPAVETPDGNTFQSTQPLSAILDREAQKCWEEYAKSKRQIETLGDFPEGHPFQSDMLRHAEHALRISAKLFIIDLALDDDRWVKANIHVVPSIWITKEFVQKAIALVEHLWSRKQFLMGDIADDRFEKANPLLAVKAMEGITTYLQKFAAKRKKKIERSLGNNALWSLRDYYRALHMPQNVAEQEMEVMLKCGLVQHAGVRRKANVYSFTETPK